MSNIKTTKEVFKLLIKSKRERFYLIHREKITMCIFSFLAVVFSVLGYRSAFNDKISGLLICDGEFRIFWSCFSVPLIMAVVPFIVKNTRKMLITVMLSKIFATLVGLSFGMNTNIHLPVFWDDWGVLFFIVIDLFIALTAYKETYERMHIGGACVIVFALMAISQVIGLLEGDFVPYYAFRSLYMIFFYSSIYSVICHVVPRYRHFPNSHEEKKLKKIFSKMSLEE